MAAPSKPALLVGQACAPQPRLSLSLDFPFLDTSEKHSPVHVALRDQPVTYVTLPLALQSAAQADHVLLICALVDVGAVGMRQPRTSVRGAPSALPSLGCF